MPTVHGLKNCDTCRKALRALDAAGIAYRFVDLKADPPTRAQAAAWLAQVPADRLINRRGTTWRQLDAKTREAAETPDGAADLLITHPSLAKRPVIHHDDGAVTVGFDEAVATRLGIGL